MTFKIEDFNNPNDPLKSGPESGQELFRRFGQLATGFPRDAVVAAAMNLLLNAIRQDCPHALGADARWSELMERGKQVLLGEHYMPNGRRRNVFAFTQNIDVGHFVPKPTKR